MNGDLFLSDVHTHTKLNGASENGFIEERFKFHDPSVEGNAI